MARSQDATAYADERAEVHELTWMRERAERQPLGAPAARRPRLVRRSGVKQSDEEAVAVLSDGDLNVGFGGDAQQSLPDRYRLLGGIEPNREDLLRTFELGNEPA